MSKSASLFVLSVSAIALAAPAAAAEPALAATGVAAAAEAAPEEEPIIIEGERSSYGASKVTSATKTSTEVKDVPQAMTIVTKAQIDDQQLRSVGDLLTFVPGASPGTGEANRDQFTLRGNNTTADLFVDGLRDDVQYFRDFYNVSRVEVLKGPNAMIFGRGGGGGIVNRVMKRTTFEPHYGGDASVDTFGGWRATADLDQPLGQAIGLRVNALYEDGDSFRRGVDLLRYGINPTLGFRYGDDSRIDLTYEYFRDQRTTDRGVPSFDGKPIEGFDRTFFGDPDDSNADAIVHRLGLSVEHRFSDALTLRHRTTYGDYDKFYQNIYPSGPVTDRDGTGPDPLTVRLAAYNDTTTRRNLLSQTDLVYEGAIGGIDQTLLAGVELGRQTGTNQRRNGIFAASGTSPTFIDVPLDEPTIDVPALTFLANGANNRVEADIAAVYAQGQFRPASWVEIVAGIRFDRFDLAIRDRNTGAGFGRRDNLVSPRLGLVFKPQGNLSLYASYSRSYLPQSGDQFSSLTLTTEALKPERFDNYEIGAKWEPIPGLLATAALYQLDRSNTRASDPLNPQITVLTGAQRSRGLELGLERSITARWQISAGYAWQKAEITETTTAAPEGREVPLVPRHSFSLWSKYKVDEKLALGLGVVARSKSYTSLSNAVKLPAYARLDAAAYYRIAEGVKAQVNVENIFNADYFPAAHNDNNIAPGAPRSAKFTLSFGM